MGSNGAMGCGVAYLNRARELAAEHGLTDLELESVTSLPVTRFN